MNIPNKITIFRILITPLFVLSILYYKASVPILKMLPLVIFLVATLSDGLDGFIARSRSQQTKLGAIIDPLADKILLMTAFICLAISPGLWDGVRLPAWVVLVVISRDVILVTGAVLIYMHSGDLTVKPSGWGKITTFFQMLTVISVLLQWEKASPVIWTITSVLTVISGLDYIRTGTIMLSENGREKR